MNGGRRVATVLLVAGAACFSDRPGTTAPADTRGCSVPGDAIGPGRAVVLIRGFAFLPDTLRVRPGTRVTWVNCEAEGTEPHTATAEQGNFDTGSIPPAGNASVTFPTAGRVGYFCRPHPFMRGAVLVE